MKVPPFSHTRPLACAALFAALGVVLGTFAPFLPFVWALGAVLGLVCALLIKKSGSASAAGLGLCALFLFALLAGTASHPKLPAEGDYRVHGIVTEDSIVQEDGHTAVYLRQVRLTDSQGEEETLPALYWTYYQSEPYQEVFKAGTCVDFSSELYHPSSRMNPSGFDFRLYLLRNGVPAAVYGRKDLTISDAPKDFAAVMTGIRSMLADKMDTFFGANSAIPKAMLLGVRDGLPQETYQAFSRAGVAHILAISGLHVGLLAAALTLLFKRWLYPPARAMTVCICLLMYCALLGFTPTVVRASIMTAAALITSARARTPDSINTLSLSFLLILLVQPLDLFSNGFILSFCAVLGIILLNTWFRKLFMTRKHNKILDGVATTFSATMGTAIPSAFIFHQFSLAGLLINPFICLGLGVLMPLYVLALVLGCISQTIGMVLGSALGWVTGLMERLIVWLGTLKFSSFCVPDIPIFLIPALIAGIIFLSPYLVMEKRKRVLLFSVLLAVGIGGHLLTIDRAVSYTQLAVGNADCAIAQDGRHVAVIDAGDDARDLCEYLLAKGKKIDTLFLTHLHEDHCLGVNDLLDEKIPIGRVVLPEKGDQQSLSSKCITVLNRLQASGIDIQYAAAGDSFQVGRMNFSVVWPQKGTVRIHQDPNTYSMGILAEMDGFTVLCASDIPGEYDKYVDATADVLKVAHHGGRQETSDVFLSNLSPAVAIVSASGRAGKPSDEVVQKLNDREIPMYVTGLDGAVRIEDSKSHLSISHYLSREAQP